jgi:hypothetical protein
VKKPQLPEVLNDIDACRTTGMNGVTQSVFNEIVPIFQVGNVDSISLRHFSAVFRLRV